MRNFSEAEFQGWLPVMSPKLLLRLDRLRDEWCKSISISKAKGAVGRLGKGESQHNVKRWGECRAVDIFPKGIDTADDARQFIELCKLVGFTGIGFYPQWTKPGFHVDVRDGERIATWGAYYELGGQRYYSIEEALEDFQDGLI